VGRILDVVAPPRMGAGFRWLLASSWTSNLGDGIALAAGPLLVASQTRDPVLVALAAVLQRLPWLLFGLWAGAIADRVDRRLLVVVADLLRAVVVAVLCAAIVTGWVDVTVVLVTTFLFGVAEVFADSASGTLLPMLVRREDLGVGNARLQAGFLTTNQLVGPPVGAFLFALGTVWPFVVQVVCVALGALLVARIATPPGAPRDLEGTHVRRDIADGLRWILRHPPVRTLALVILAFNVTWGAAWSVLVLWSQEVLGMGPVGYGLLTTAVAVGGLASTSTYDVIERRVPLATLMRVCLLLEVVTHLALALTRTGWVALVIMVVFGAYAFVWGTVSQTVRQRAVPLPFQGRVGSVYVVGLFLGLVVGQALGGVIADRWGLTAPFWFAFVGSGITLVLVWRQLAAIAHTGEPGAADSAAGGGGPVA
jgi:MFS family permease